MFICSSFIFTPFSLLHIFIFLYFADSSLTSFDICPGGDVLLYSLSFFSFFLNR
ncbi:hypothetical protein F4775DRAFT_538897 [Biscogniauxia sp. FL1348]|nr:hypothetical protein F4775DRAFT_538897 [Biscogniauxia sp. FL1348]